MSISSSRIVPSPAAANLPTFARVRAVNAPFAWPKNSLAIRLPESAPHASRRTDAGPRREQSWISLARSGLARARFALDQHRHVVRRGDAQLLDHRCQRRRVVDEPAADLRGDGLGRGVGERRAGSSARRAQAVNSRVWCGHTKRLARYGREVVEEPEVRGPVPTQRRRTARGVCWTFDSRTAVSIGGGVGRVEREEEEVAVGLRGDRFGTSSNRTTGAVSCRARWR